jgi:DNA primase
VRVLQIQGAKDPDEYIKTFGRESFAQKLEQSEDHIEYTLANIQKKYHLAEDSQKIDFVQEAAQMIADLPSPVEREVYSGRVSMIASIEKDAVLQEVNRALKRKLSQAKKKHERSSMLPTQMAQPKQRELRYDNLRSALAEEGVLRLLLLDESLYQRVNGLTEEQFSSPFLGKLYRILCRRREEGRSIQIGALADELTPEEVSHLTLLLEKPEDISRGSQAMADYLAIIAQEQYTKAGETDELLLLAARENYQKKKAWEM